MASLVGDCTGQARHRLIEDVGMLQMHATLRDAAKPLYTELPEHVYNPRDMIKRTNPRVESDGHMAAADGYHELENGAVAHDEIVQPADVDVAALARKREQGGIHEQFFVAI